MSRAPASSARAPFTIALSVGLLVALAACAPTPAPAVDVPPPSTAAAAAPTASAPAAATSGPSTAGDVAASAAALRAALAARDYDALQAMMGETFVLGLHRAEGMTVDAAGARAALESRYLPPAADPAAQAVDTTDDRAAFPAVDPPLETLFDPALIVNRLLFSRGWGADGLGEAVLVLAERPDGSVYWHGMVFAPAGFGGPPSGASAGAAGAIAEGGGDATVGGPTASGDGFAVDGPAGWTATESGGGVILTSFAMGMAGRGGLGAGQTKIDVLPLAGEPAPRSLAEAIAVITRDGSSAGSSPTSFLTATGLAGMRVRDDLAVIDLGGRFVVASCYGAECDVGSGVFDRVAASVRVE